MSSAEQVPFNLPLGAIIDAEAQVLRVNCVAAATKEGMWVAAKGVRIDADSKWYWARIKTDYAGTTEGPYLVSESVNHDGWGAITVHRNVTLISSEPYFLPVKQNAVDW